jgi:ornithine cyclodeaminase
MVRFLSASAIGNIFNRVGRDQFWLRLLDYLERDFRRWESFAKTPRLASHSADGVIELMPTSDGETYCFKFVNGHPKNTFRGLQTVAAFGVLADVETGYPRLLADMTLATAFRTAAASVLAARYLARPESEVMALIGLGAQSEFQACAFQAALGVNRLRVYDVDPAAAEKFQRNMIGSGLTIIRCASAQDAVIGADIVTTITADKQMATILSDNMVGAGTHLNAVGGDCPGKTELAREILLRAEIFVEYAPQTRLEGEIQQLGADHPVTELWEVVAGRKPGRPSRGAVTVFDGVGFAIEDFSILRLLRDLADELRIDDEIDLIARPDDPKNLFALLRAPRTDRSLRWA